MYIFVYMLFCREPQGRLVRQLGHPLKIKSLLTLLKMKSLLTYLLTYNRDFFRFSLIQKYRELRKFVDVI